MDALFAEAAAGWPELIRAPSANDRQMAALDDWEETILSHQPTSAQEASLMIDCLLGNRDARSDGLDRQALRAIQTFLLGQ